MKPGGHRVQADIGPLPDVKAAIENSMKHTQQTKYRLEYR